MKVYGKTTKKSVEELFNKAKEFFGESGLALRTSTDERCCLSFEGGGGFVNITISEENPGKTEFTVETREWDYQVKKFLEKI